MKKVTPRFKMESVLTQGHVRIIDNTFYWISNDGDTIYENTTKGVKLREFIAYVYELIAISQTPTTPELRTGDDYFEVVEDVQTIEVHRSAPETGADAVQKTISELDAILTSWTKLR